MVEGHWRDSFHVNHVNPAAMALFKAKNATQFKKSFGHLLLKVIARKPGDGVELELRCPTLGVGFVYVRVRVVFVGSASKGHVVLFLDDIGRQKKTENLLKRQASVDGLTGMLNQRAILSRLDEELARAKRYKEDLSCVLFDLDAFKMINDTFGHVYGSKFLKKAARLLKQSLRQTDIVGRYGGDEFLVILPETSAEQAAVPVDRFLKLYVKHSLARVKGKSVRTTFSVGICGYPVTGVKSSQDFIAHADRALYLSKTSGGNMFHTFGIKKA